MENIKLRLEIIYITNYVRVSNFIEFKNEDNFKIFPYSTNSTRTESIRTRIKASLLTTESAAAQIKENKS
jgi:hypothetical protein